MSTENKLKKSKETKNINQILQFMKKIFMALVLCLVSICGYGQKTFSSTNFINETIDEFGDKTGNINIGIIAKGYFSNSETTNSCAELIISFSKKSSCAYLYEYCRERRRDDIFDQDYHREKDRRGEKRHNKFHIIVTGTTTNKTIKLRSKSIDYSFVELCENNDTIKIKVIEDHGDSSMTAVFKLYDCKDFYSKYIGEFGKSNYITYLWKEENLSNDKKFVSLRIFSSPIPERYMYNGVSGISNDFTLAFANLGGFDMLFIYSVDSVGGKYVGRFLDTEFKEYVNDPIYCEVYINDIKIKSSNTNPYSFMSQDIISFLNAIKPNCEVSIYNRETYIKESFILTQEQYDVIRKFYSLQD